jgi:hypothetical protein
MASGHVTRQFFTWNYDVSDRCMKDSSIAMVWWNKTTAEWSVLWGKTWGSFFGTDLIKYHEVFYIFVLFSGSSILSSDLFSASIFMEAIGFVAE